MIEKTIELKQSWVAFLTLGHPNVVIEVFQQHLMYLKIALLVVFQDPAKVFQSFSATVNLAIFSID